MASLCDLCGTAHERTLCDTAEQVRRVQTGEPPLGYLDGTIYIASVINDATPEQLRAAALLAEARRERDEKEAWIAELHKALLPVAPRINDGTILLLTKETPEGKAAGEALERFFGLLSGLLNKRGR